MEKKTKSRILFGAVLVVVFIFFLILKDVPLKAYSLIFDYKKITPLSPFYHIVIFREFMQENFTFGDEEESYRYLNLANKRIVEATYLQSSGALKLAEKQMNLAKEYQEKGSELLKNLKDKVDINYLLQLQENNYKQLELFNITKH